MSLEPLLLTFTANGMKDLWAIPIMIGMGIAFIAFGYACIFIRASLIHFQRWMKKQLRKRLIDGKM